MARQPTVSQCDNASPSPLSTAAIYLTKGLEDGVPFTMALRGAPSVTVCVTRSVMTSAGGQLQLTASLADSSSMPTAPRPVFLHGVTAIVRGLVRQLNDAVQPLTATASSGQAGRAIDEKALGDMVRVPSRFLLVRCLDDVMTVEAAMACLLIPLGSAAESTVARGARKRSRHAPVPCAATNVPRPFPQPISLPAKVYLRDDTQCLVHGELRCCTYNPVLGRSTFHCCVGGRLCATEEDAVRQLYVELCRHCGLKPEGYLSGRRARSTGQLVVRLASPQSEGMEEIVTLAALRVRRAIGPPTCAVWAPIETAQTL